MQSNFVSYLPSITAGWPGHFECGSSARLYLRRDWTDYLFQLACRSGLGTDTDIARFK